MTGPVLVTGAGGFIGRRLVAMLRARDTQVIAWTRAEVDLADAAQVTRAMKAAGAGTVYHLASSGVAPEQQVEACIARDLAMTEAILAALPAGATLVQAGSMAEYGASGRLREEQACRPATFYGRAKLACTRHALEHGPARGVAVRVGRIFGAYGAGERPGRLIPNLVEKLSRGEPLPLSDGVQRRDFIHVDDVCAALIDLAALPVCERALLVNIGTGRAITVRAAAERIADLLGADRGLLRFGATPRRATDEDMLEADTSRFAALIGSVPPQHLCDSDDAALAVLIGATGAR